MQQLDAKFIKAKKRNMISMVKSMKKEKIDEESEE
jgi:hypothetical protein